MAGRGALVILGANMSVEDFHSINKFFGRMSGATVALNREHTIARAALMNQIMYYSPCHQVLTFCWQQNGMLAQAVPCRRLILELTNAMGLTVQDFYLLIKSNQKERLNIEAGTEEKQARIRTLINDFEHEFSELLRRFRETNHTIIADRIIGFVKQELKLPWAWVAYELGEASYRWLFDIALCRMRYKTVWVEPIDPPAPPIDFAFRTSPDESVSEARKRFIEEQEQIKRQLDTYALPAGKSRNPEAIERHVDWFFRNRILGESITSIAKSLDEEREPDRKTVRDGINDTFALLSIASQFWNDVETIGKSERKFWYSADEMDGD